MNTPSIIDMPGSGGVTMTNIDANNNQGNGLEVYSRGLITLTGAWASNNPNWGIRLENDICLTGWHQHGQCQYQ